MSHALNILNSARERKQMRANALRFGRVSAAVSVLGLADGSASEDSITQTDTRLRQMLDEMTVRLGLRAAGNPVFTTENDLRTGEQPIVDTGHESVE